VIERVTGRKLVMPLDLAGLRIERVYRVGIEVVALANSGVERPGIADAPIHGMELGIERAGNPGRAAAVLPGVSRPGLVARLARARHRIGAPDMLAGLRIPAVDEQARPELRTRDAGQDDAVGDERRSGHRISVLEVDDVLLPHLLAGFGIERHDIGVER